MVAEAISAPYEEFRKGMCRIRGYCLQDEGNRIHLAFEPWFAESDDPFSAPCLRLEFRRLKNRVVLEKFVVCDGGEERAVDLAAAHDALQAWMDCVSD